MRPFYILHNGEKYYKTFLDKGGTNNFPAYQTLDGKVLGCTAIVGVLAAFMAEGKAAGPTAYSVAAAFAGDAVAKEAAALAEELEFVRRFEGSSYE